MNRRVSLAEAAAAYRIGFALCVITLAGAFGAQAAPAPRAVKVTWLGHACFLFQSAEGKRVIIDPFDARTGYPKIRAAADVVVVTHEHFDHNAVGEVSGRPAVLREPRGRKSAAGIEFLGVKTYHDTQQGRQRGENTVVVFEVDGVRFCHAGDLGEALSPDQVRRIGRVDVVMLPVGGFFTLDLADANRVVAQLKPKVAIPMHYRTRYTAPGLRMLAGVGGFLRGKKNVRMIKGSQVTVSSAGLPNTTAIWVLEPPAGKAP